MSSELKKFIQREKPEEVSVGDIVNVYPENNVIYDVRIFGGLTPPVQIRMLYGIGSFSANMIFCSPTAVILDPVLISMPRDARRSAAFL